MRPIYPTLTEWKETMETMTAWDLQAELARSIYHGAVQNVVRAIVADRNPNRVLNADDVRDIAYTIETDTRYGIDDEDRARMANDVRKVADTMAAPEGRHPVATMLDSAVKYETVMFEAENIDDPNYEGVSSGIMSRADAIEQFRLNTKIMLAHNGMIVECGDNVDGLPYAKFADGSALETYEIII